MTVSLVNLGCKVNQYELQAIKTSLNLRGHTVYENLVCADVYILNTCAVTNEAERKSRQFVTKTLKKNPNARVIAVGCASERNKENFLNKGARYVSGSFDKSSIADVVDGFEREKTNGKTQKINGDFEGKNGEVYFAADKKSVYERMDFASTGRSRQFIKIQDGCDNFCSYCIIPHLRGRSRSRREDDIIEEIRGVSLKEIVLIGINLSAYGKDIGSSLANVLKAVRSARPDLRVRLGSLEANVVGEEFLSELALSKNFCPHFHLSLQSGDDGVLKDMNRRYGTRSFLEKIEILRKYFPGAAITTDIIVGFPTESAEAFENTLRFAERAEFSDIHIFPFSVREGTAAAKLKAVAADDEIKARVKRLTETKRELKERYIRKFIGKEINVLIEETADGEASGYSENYIRAYAKTCGGENGELQIGDVYKMKIEGIYKDGAVCGL
ncbi:MAG: tRNA (N(6)-L-threonylcarbamoyladenosine(37)-C(2))-methylthiotransferase MtaB [Clostridiales bacterium]|jgi:threonylcarbamoyladenosine tRNA methylthiotransferase MtaB|nr:tRNA (N(6)-L-threonylcarbamoyladenosine(37)-C(2))-methylthiotransferase MtaB [Clostridiales bacterium]